MPCPRSPLPTTPPRLRDCSPTPAPIPFANSSAPSAAPRRSSLSLVANSFAPTRRPLYPEPHLVHRRSKPLCEIHRCASDLTIRIVPSPQPPAHPRPHFHPPATRPTSIHTSQNAATRQSPPPIAAICPPRWDLFSAHPPPPVRIAPPPATHTQFRHRHRQFQLHPACRPISPNPNQTAVPHHFAAALSGSKSRACPRPPAE